MDTFRRLTIIASFLFAACAARGQEHCAESKPTQSIEALQDRVTTLQGELASAQEAGSGDTSVRKLQEHLLSATEDLECKQANSVSSPKGILTTSTFVQVPLLYVTDRRMAAGTYTSEAATALAFGRVNAVINEIGGIRTSFIAGTKRVAAPASMGRAQVQRPQPLTEKAFRDGFTAPSQGVAKRRVLLFVHGFNVQFYEAALSLARLATSMQVPLVPMFYSWPSEGKVTGYWRDEDAVSAAAVRFTPFLEQLLSGPVDEVVIVCHSMGSRIVTRSLGELARRQAKLPALKKVVFAAADINVEEFDAQWPSLRRLSAAQWAFYESSGDVALRLSKFVHQFRRVGESDGGVYVADGGDTIDASSTTSILRTLGHSYIVSSPALAADIGDWVTQDLPPAVRGLQRMTQGAAVYWKMP
jgi:esterase/lipase superfamily enzyme